MAITYGNENGSSIIGNIPVGLYFYYISKGDITNMNYLGYAPTIESVTYNPFIETDDISLVGNNFDTSRFGTPDGGIPKCYRIIDNNSITKRLYNEFVFSNKSAVDYTHEPKMECFPYRYYLITDYINPPIIIKPELIETPIMEIKVTTSPISQSGKYNLWVNNYKGDKNGNLEGMVNNSSLMLPVASSTYAQFLATSSASFNQSITNALLENDMTLRHGTQNNSLNAFNSVLGGGISAITGLLSGNALGVVGGVTGGTMGVVNSMVNQNQLNERTNLKENIIASNVNAQISDMLSTPRSIKTTGNDTLFNLVNSRQKIDLIEYIPTKPYRDRIKDYFNRYGYSVNKYAPINFKSRKYYNFIKTHICNITSATVPHEHIQEIKDIFNSGITFWHISNGATVENYNVNNEEV